ncbi:hypothetical protein JKA74_02340 [Marivirga sp. S37H4]|uniref:Uncharacterized protein n=1 Tax=Marivirga aurantiaca TaxID=2802615 RepID=A0A935C6N8_9BACT|nr:hypothetical protein [Marivirga aurantiaca]MBK6263862.1 hypothetical protein [Marivirga aurantiaca]
MLVLNLNEIVSLALWRFSALSCSFSNWLSKSFFNWPIMVMPFHADVFASKSQSQVFAGGKIGLVIAQIDLAAVQTDLAALQV